MSIRKTKRFGWLPDLPDARDHLFAAGATTIRTLPASVDLRPGCPPVYDQGELGACTANAVAGAIEFDRLRQNLSDYVPSRLFIYYNERVIMHTVASDSGAMIRDGIKSVGHLGACPEKLWPYKPTKFKTKPTAACFQEALAHRAVSYQKIPRHLPQMKGCLADGFPFVFGFTVYDSFEGPEVAKTGIALMPTPQEGSLGGHAVMAVGYDDATQRFLVRNS